MPGTFLFLLPVHQVFILHVHLMLPSLFPFAHSHTSLRFLKLLFNSGPGLCLGKAHLPILIWTQKNTAGMDINNDLLSLPKMSKSLWIIKGNGGTKRNSRVTYGNWQENITLMDGYRKRCLLSTLARQVLWKLLLCFSFLAPRCPRLFTASEHAPQYQVTVTNIK